MNSLVCALSPDEFNIVQIFYVLQVTREGTNKFKDSKINLLIRYLQRRLMRPLRICFLDLLILLMF